MRAILVSVVLFAGLFPAGRASAEMVGGGDINFRPKNAQPVVFSHEGHVNGKGMKCARCHYSIFQMMRGNSGITMDQVKEGKFCGKCHNGTQAFDATDQKNCSRCHK